MSTDSVTMLRSRGERPGRFHTSPRRRSCVYLSRAGATIRTSSGENIGLPPGPVFVWEWTANAAMSNSDTKVAAIAFISAFFRLEQRIYAYRACEVFGRTFPGRL